MMGLANVMPGWHCGGRTLIATRVIPRLGTTGGPANPAQPSDKLFLSYPRGQTTFLLQYGTARLKRSHIDTSIQFKSKQRMAINSPITIRPFELSDTEIDFGAELLNVNVLNITPADFAVIRHAVYTHQVVVVNNQS